MLSSVLHRSVDGQYAVAPAQEALEGELYGFGFGGWDSHSTCYTLLRSDPT